MSNHRIIVRRAAQPTQIASGELGAKVEAGARTVFLEGGAWFSSYIVQLREFEAQLFNYFVAKGWALRSLQLTPTGSSLNTLESVKIKIEAVVNPQYSDGNVKNEAFNLLSDYKTTFGSYLTNVSLAVTKSSTGKPPVDEKDKPDFLGGEFFQALATTLGVSIPVATVGGVLIAIWWLKR